MLTLHTPGTEAPQLRRREVLAEWSYTPGWPA